MGLVKQFQPINCLKIDVFERLERAILYRKLVDKIYTYIDKSQSTMPLNYNDSLGILTDLERYSEELYKSLLHISCKSIEAECGRYQLLINLKCIANECSELSIHVFEFLLIDDKQDVSKIPLRRKICSKLKSILKNLEEVNTINKSLSIEILESINSYRGHLRVIKND